MADVLARLASALDRNDERPNVELATMLEARLTKIDAPAKARRVEKVLWALNKPSLAHATGTRPTLIPPLSLR